MRAFAPVMLWAVVLVMVFAVAVLAADEAMPWDDLEITIGGVVLLWAGIVAAVVEIGKHVYFGDRPLLDTSAKIWGANLLLGGVGVFVHQMMQGSDILPALLAAGAAVLTASGLFEGIKTVAGKSPPKEPEPSSHGGTG